MVQITELILS